MLAVIHSGKLEQRQIPHVKVTREQFMTHFRSKRVRVPRPRKNYGRAFKVPRAVSTMMGKKTWVSPTQDSNNTLIMAWHWAIHRHL